MRDAIIESMRAFNLQIMERCIMDRGNASIRTTEAVALMSLDLRGTTDMVQNVLKNDLGRRLGVPL